MGSFRSMTYTMPLDTTLMSHIPRCCEHAHRILDCQSNGLSLLGSFNRIPVNIITAIILSRSMYAISSFLIVNCLGFPGTEETVSLIEVIGVSIMNVSFPFNQLYDIGERIHFIRRVYWKNQCCLLDSSLCLIFH